MATGGHFNRKMVEGFDFPEFKDADPRQQEEIINEMNIIHMNNDKEDLVMGDRQVFDLAKSIVIDGKTRIYPTKEQEVLLQKHFGCVRFVYNWALDFNKKLYA